MVWFAYLEHCHGTLNLPRMLYHLSPTSPKCYTDLHVPALSNLHSNTKLTFFSTISTSKDPFIQDMLPILTDVRYCKSQKTDPADVDLVQNYNRSGTCNDIQLIVFALHSTQHMYLCKQRKKSLCESSYAHLGVQKN